MDLAIVGSRGIPAHYGGYETFAEELSTRLTDRGYEVCVTCEGYGQAKWYNNVNLIYVPIITKIIPRNLAEVIHDICAIMYVSIFIRPKIIYLLGYAACYTCIISRCLGIKVWINADGLEWKRRKFGSVGRAIIKALEGIAVKVSNLMIADSKHIQKYLFEEYHINSSYIPYGAYPVKDIDPNLITKFNTRPKEYYLVVARIEPENNIDVIIDGFVKSNSKKQLIVVGKVQNNNYGKMLLCKASDRVHFIGGIYDKNLLNALRLHCFAYFHGHEVGGTNPSLLEALACGNIIIAIDVPFTREVARNAAYFFTDASSLCEVINEVESSYINYPEREELSRDRLIKAGYTWDNVLKCYQILLEKNV
ncbi:DUF1972 domain-containing protein [Desulfotomaculum copahuensis]|uniref:Glycosyl transferase n=1 Tax=Desulfotomaculum copahuensis TaxID=1838280 RepID=A0A1B7LGD7_9FIRM|nr:DUF1972 domain-containing protein [Desulfotomaculum copahuensis]OAT85105.1 hypothetical protein A6M21_07095 [Desulfotomaculum copahuensis]